MRRILLAALAVTVALPTVATAQSGPGAQHEVRRDDPRGANQSTPPRQQQQTPQKPQTQPAKPQAQQQKPQVQPARPQAQQAHREEWQDHRKANRNLYKKKAYVAPKGYKYKAVKVGAKLDRPLYAKPYWVTNYSTYRLPKLSKNLNYIRYGNDVLVVNMTNGRVTRVYDNFFW